MPDTNTDVILYVFSWINNALHIVHKYRSVFIYILEKLDFHFCVKTYQKSIKIKERRENELFNTLVPSLVLCIIIGDVHQFIGNCLIPFDPWIKIDIR